MDANKKVDLENPMCPDENRILADILKNHPLGFNIVASSSMPLIYLEQFWHTLHEDGSKYTLKFMLDRKELTLTLDDFKTIFHLPKATDNNHDHFVPSLMFFEMVPFYLNDLGFTLELRSTSKFKTTGLLQPIALGRILILFKESNNTDSLPQIHKADRELSAPRRSTVIRLCIPPQRSTCLTLPTVIPTTNEADDLILQDTLQIDSYAIDDDVLPSEKVLQELVDEISQTIDEAKLRKVVDEMLRQQCTLVDEQQYHIDQMQKPTLVV
uniref:Uncharacterized protein n=1 Tax=Tanacetum cinerariifolium TaxID=118510 RepID=A0A6L2K7L5_TANCI|nr:hypothetical protein [Tanacetum cinerariifolium]